MRSFVKIQSLRNGEITLSFTDIGRACSSHEYLASQICLLTLFAKIIILAKKSGLTVIVVHCHFDFDRECYMSVHVLMNALNKFGQEIKCKTYQVKTLIYDTNTFLY